MINMENELNHKAQGLTADAKQKISLGRGMVREDVNAILFDEPLTVIDPHLKWELRTQLKALHHKLGHTMIYVTHDQTEALTFADKVVVMLEGEVLQVGTPTELFERPAHTFVGYFIGSPGMNVLDAKVTGNKIIVDGYEITLPHSYPDLNGKIELGIRPEFVKLSKDKTDLPINIKRIEDIGLHRIVRAEFNGKDMNIIVKEDTVISDDMQYVSFDKERINIYQDSWIVDGQHHSDSKQQGERS